MKKKVILLLCLGLFLTTGCGKVPALKNGEEVFAKINKKNVTANDMFDKLKEKYGRDVLIETIDTLLLEDKYKEDDDLLDYVESQIQRTIQYYGEEEYQKLLAQSGMTEKDLRKQYSLEYRRNKAVEDYVKGNITDKEIDDYYKNSFRGDIKASHILIKPDVEDDASDEEKATAKEAALKKAKDIIKELDGGADFAELAKKHSDDGSAEKGGDLGYFPIGQMVDEFEDAVAKLEKGKYSKTPVESQFGYHIILKVDQKSKPKLKEVKDTIIETLVNKKLTDDANLWNKALYEVRKEAGLEIHDDSVKKSYESYMDTLMKQSTN